MDITSLVRLQYLMKEGEEVVIYGIERIVNKLGSSEGHFFYGIKKNEELYLIDPQVGRFMKLKSETASDYILPWRRNGFRYLKVRK